MSLTRAEKNAEAIKRYAAGKGVMQLSNAFLNEPIFTDSSQFLASELGYLKMKGRNSRISQAISNPQNYIEDREVLLEAIINGFPPKGVDEGNWR